MNMALHYYRMAAGQGHTAALYNLGTMYEMGDGVKKDCKEAVKFYLMSAEEGDPDALWAVGCFYERGEGVKQDYQLAVKYFLLASKTVLDPSVVEKAQNRLSGIFTRKKGTEYQKEAIEYVLITPWPKSHSLLHSHCRNAIRALWYYYRNFSIRNIPSELIINITKFLIAIWPDNHFTHTLAFDDESDPNPKLVSDKKTGNFGDLLLNGDEQNDEGSDEVTKNGAYIFVEYLNNDHETYFEIDTLVKND